MRTISQLKKEIEELHIKPTDTVMIHTSLRAIGEVENGAEGIIKAFTDYLKDGLLLIPTHTWSFINEEKPTLDLMNPITCIGTLPNRAATHPLGKRSYHPTHSMTAFGKRAKDYIKGEESSDTPTSPDGCWGRLYQENAKILLIGVGQERNTFLHAVEEINHTPQRLSEEKKQLLIRNEDGTIVKRYSHVHYNPYCDHISENYVKFEPYFYYGKALSYGTLGEAKVQVCDARGCADIMIAISNHCDFDLCIDDTPIPFPVEELDNLLKK